jgi:diphosphomevalonate decarboxylase
MKRSDWETQTLPASARTGRVFSPSNIALAKYWGKRDTALNLPTNGSLSATLEDFGSFTTVSFDDSFAADRLFLNGEEARGGKLGKVLKVLDLVRSLAGVKAHALVQSANNFPTGAGLASSASGLSAVTLAAASALGVDQDLTKLSEIARKGSGSACRSFWGGYVEWARGDRADGGDSVGRPVAEESHWPLDAFILIVSGAEKHQGSTNGMEVTRLTSPYFPAWVESAEASLAPIRGAILQRDFTGLAELAEVNCLRFHTSAMAAQPPVIYWQGRTLDLIHRVRRMRAEGLNAFFTVDAGPNVVVFADPAHSTRVEAVLRQEPGVQVLKTRVGRGARKL